MLPWYRTNKFPKEYKGWKTTNGEKSDLRFLDPPNSICALKAKGKMIHDKSGFVIDDI